MALAFKAFGCFYMKIPDSFRADRFTPAKNFDAFIIYDGTFCAIEYKMVKGKSLPISSIRPIQLEKMAEVMESMGTGYFCINHRWKDYNDTYMVPAEIMLDLIDRTTKKSIPIDDLKAHKLPGKINIPGLKGRYWDIHEFLEGL